MNTKYKIFKLQSLKSKLNSLRAGGKRIAFTNGCFDILHFGHVSYLEAAKKDNRVLVIGLNSDQSICKIKGPQRPIIAQDKRAALLAALQCVDFVTIFNEETPLKVIRVLKPDILIKGADWKGKDVIGSEVVKSYGGHVEYISYIPGCSTTEIIEKITHGSNY